MERFGELLQRSGATHVCSTPALFSAVTLSPSELPALRCVALGGEPMPAALLTKWRGGAGASLRLYNIYGVTECTVYQMSRPIPNMPASQGKQGVASGAIKREGVAAEATLLGSPLPGCELLLLDEQLQATIPHRHLQVHTQRGPRRRERQFLVRRELQFQKHASTERVFFR